ncbi:MAG: hypothetical protein LBE76_03750 [Nitrososphaerota archaeon]|jgi:hypothetical protein|nr:hypothetical protein [Nitrososphaerota archaeon]
MYRIGLSDIFACKLDSEAYSFLPQYLSMVEWWMAHGRASAQKFSNFTSFRNQFYSEWKVDWRGYNSQHAQTSCLFALRALNSEVKSKEALTNRFAIISPVSVKIEGKKFIFVTRNAKKAHVELVPKSVAQGVLLDQVQNMYWKIGQVFLTPKWCNIPFTRDLDLTKENDPTLIEYLKYNL